MKYKHVFFDYDGTLADTISGITFACNKVAEIYNVNKRFDDALVTTFIGEGSKRLFLRAFDYEDLDSTNEKMYEDFMYYYLNFQTDHLKLYDNCVEVLKTLQNLNHFLYIYSNKPHNILLECVKITLGDIKFEFILGNRTEDKPKPDPESINKYLEEHNIDKKDVIYVGDSPVDLKFAQNLGVDSLILTHGYWNQGKIEDANPTYLAKNMKDILTYIK